MKMLIYTKPYSMVTKAKGLILKKKEDMSHLYCMLHGVLIIIKLL